MGIGSFLLNERDMQGSMRNRLSAARFSHSARDKYTAQTTIDREPSQVASSLMLQKNGDHIKCCEAEVTIGLARSEADPSWTLERQRISTQPHAHDYSILRDVSLELRLAESP